MSSKPMQTYPLKSQPRVIIIGASFAGLKAAITLPRQFAVTVIDKSPWFEFLPNIHELVSGIKTPDMLRFSNSALVRRAGHKYLYDTVTEILPEKNQVITRHGKSLYYDFCIIAAGIFKQLGVFQSITSVAAGQ